MNPMKTTTRKIGSESMHADLNNRRFGAETRLQTPAAHGRACATRMRAQGANLAFAAVIAALFSFTLTCTAPSHAFATDDESLVTTTSDLLQATQIETLTQSYEDALAQVDAAEQRISEHQEHIRELQEQIDAQQAVADKAVKTAYKVQQDKVGTLEMLLGARSLEEFVLETEYLERINRACDNELDKLASYMDELSKTQQSLEQAKGEAGAQAARAQEALRSAQDDRAQRAASAKADDGADWYMSEEEFIEEWAPRLNKYLAGSALDGQGEHFARSAWRYCIDPRWSAAISCIESGKGASCIRPHNAWGWGASDEDPVNLASEWDSWETAIDAHARGLARGYGYTVSKAGAKTYCPPNWEKWYDTVKSEMSSI